MRYTRTAFGLFICTLFIGGWSSTAAADPVWKKIFDGPANGEDVASESVADSQGNVYVVGRSDESDHESDLFVVKYDSDGNELWTARVDSDESGYDSAAGVARVPSGGVIVVGILGGPFRAEKSDWSDDRREASAGDDGSHESDWGVARIESDGSVAWKKRLDGPGGGDDAASSAFVANGSVYVQGMTADTEEGLAHTVAKLDLSDGKKNWMQRMDDYSFDPADNDKVDSTGGFGLQAELVTPAPDDDVYTAGLGAGPSGQLDLLLARLDESGDVVWDRTWDVGNTFDTATSLVTDGGNAVVVGETLDTDDSLDMVLLEVTPDNNLAWTRRIDTIPNVDTSEDDLPIHSAADLALDDSNELYAVGYRERDTGDSSDEDLLTVAVDGSSGDVRWEETLDKGLVDEGTAIEVADDDNLYVVGGSGGLRGIGYVTANYNPSDGSEKWNRLWNNDGSGVGAADTVSLLPDGGLVVSGALGQNGEALTSDIGTVKYNSSEPTDSPADAASGCAGCLGGIAGSSGGGGSSLVLVVLGLLGLRIRRA